MIHIQTPPGCTTERHYILRIIFDDWLGLPWSVSSVEREDMSMTLAGQPGEIRLPDRFFGQFKRSTAAWLNAASLPQPPLAHWDTRELSARITLTDPVVPLIQGNPDPTLRLTDEHLALPIDLFGSAFFMLSRYEEAVLPERDHYDRFPATASLAYQAGFLDRPIIDEYIEILWAAMQRVWPGLARQTRTPCIRVSCDVDHPFALVGSPLMMARRLASDLLRHRSPTRAGANLRGYWRALHDDYTHDPYRNALDWIMDINENAGHRVAFYFIPEKTHSRFDQALSLDDPRMRMLLRQIHTRGHEIGIHPGYNTYQHPSALARSVATLRRVLDEESITQPLLGGRQHFLRWAMPTTARLWNDNGLDYDSTLSFADRPGFRCGTCHDYPLYDLTHRHPLRLRERPLIVMECSVIADRYLGLGYSAAALPLMQGYRDTCHRFGGAFTLLWHNSHLTTAQDRAFYRALVV